MSLKAKIEAVLFLTAKPIRAQALARVVNADVQAVRQAVLELVHDYEERKGGLEISDEDGYSFQVKEEYAQLMDEFLPIEMSAALIRTLSAIAIKQPISQSDIIRVRGAGAYDHIKELVNRDLVAKKDEQGGRSPILSTTKKFQEYFRLTKEGKDLRTYLKKQVRKAVAADAAGAANDRQLVIPEVVGNSEAENQLNQGIFLETADYAADNATSDVSDIVAASASESANNTDDAAVKTLSKLAAAAATNEPDRLAADTATDNSVLETNGLAEVLTPSMDLTPAPPELESVVGTGGTDEPPPGGSMQARMVRKKEPGIAKDKRAKNKRGREASCEAQTIGLTDLLIKQRLFQRQLKLGVFTGEEGEVILDFEPVNPTPPPAIDKAV